MTATTTDPQLWVRTYHPAPGSRVRLVCFPHAGGSASYFHPVSAALAPSVRVEAIQYPGRQDRHSERCVDRIGDLAGLICQVLAAAGGGDVPVAYFGHSMGAVLAFEVARLIEAQGGAAPALIFASGRRAPGTLRDESVHKRDNAGVIAEMRSLGGTDSRVLGDPELLEMVLPAMRADYRAIETYRCEPGAVVSVPIVVLTGDNDPKTTLDEARAWEQHTTAGTELRVFPGGHFYLEKEAGAVIATIRDTLTARVQG